MVGIDDLSAPAERSRLDATDIQQPVLFTLQVSLARLWMELGIEPEAFVGYSIGEGRAGLLWRAGCQCVTLPGSPSPAPTLSSTAPRRPP
ncbi:acyltransferase domain-containing protein [Salinispora arenicola]|uniref:acyltransferase domain-containing protein n=1 Tax=Salinispora arenicola TaxID=168697 RepID=UPI0027DD3522|nr:acyltransferase domain-containing protein [Salinispora arenicola]